MTKNLAVFAGRYAPHTSMIDQLQEFGAFAAEGGWHVYYGGGDEGVMGQIALGALQGRGAVTAVLTSDEDPPVFSGVPAASTIQRVQTAMHRTDALIQNADAFCVLPGGLGTLSEFLTALHVWFEEKPRRPFLVYDWMDVFKDLRGFLKDLKADGWINEHATFLDEPHSRGAYPFLWTPSLEEGKSFLEDVGA